MDITRLYEKSHRPNRRRDSGGGISFTATTKYTDPIHDYEISRSRLFFKNRYLLAKKKHSYAFMSNHVKHLL